MWSRKFFGNVVRQKLRPLKRKGINAIKLIALLKEIKVWLSDIKWRRRLFYYFYKYVKRRRRLRPFRCLIIKLTCG